MSAPSFISNPATSSWRRDLRGKLWWLLAAKLLGLILLWAFFFSPAHRVHVNPALTERHFSLTGLGNHD